MTSQNSFTQKNSSSQKLKKIKKNLILTEVVLNFIIDYFLFFLFFPLFDIYMYVALRCTYLALMHRFMHTVLVTQKTSLIVLIRVWKWCHFYVLKKWPVIQLSQFIQFIPSQYSCTSFSSPCPVSALSQTDIGEMKSF